MNGRWVYLYRAMDSDGATIDFMLSETRDRAAVLRFFKRAIGSGGFPEKVNIDKSGANTAALERINNLLFLCGLWPLLIEVRRIKYLNNLVIIGALNASRSAHPGLNHLNPRKRQLRELSCTGCLKKARWKTQEILQPGNSFIR